MALSFGVTVLPDPPASRLVELMVLGERNGFEIGWTYDSHYLWQESFPLLTLAIQATSTMKFGHLVTNPGTREPTVLASLYATMHDISDGRMVMGIGRGDSARRTIGQQPVRVAEFERSLPDDQGLDERPRGAVERQGAEARVGAAGAAGDPDVGRRLRPEGARRRRPGRGRRDHPARRPRDHPVDHGHRPRGGRGGGTRPRRAQVHRLRAEPRRADRGRARADALVPRDGLEPRQGPDRALRHRRLGRSRRRSPTTSRRASSTTTPSIRASARSTASS